MADKDSPVTFIFDYIAVNSIETTSGIFVGENSQPNWTAVTKSNNGFGTFDGEMNLVNNLLTVIIDPDVVDSPSIITHSSNKKNKKK